MNPIRGRSLLLGAVLIFLIALPVFAQPVFAESGHRKIEGKGTLFAAGAGIDVLKGDASVKIVAKGVGLVWIRGAEIISVHGDGIKTEYRGGTLYMGWRGRIEASGSQLEVRIEGALIEFLASGSGRAFLEGRGIYRISGATGDWPAIVHYQLG
ncbi:MAG: hypothetical protein NTX81_09140 [Candidatus Bathyarchaeota archaeon]|nr:hypothetical protein [Candidatus Bathyarchaeota archaeon]